MKFSHKRQETRTGILLVMVAIGALVGSLTTWLILQRNATSRSSQYGAIRENDEKRLLIKPLLAYSTPEMLSASPVKNGINTVIDNYVSRKKVTTVSVYYRDLNTGQWFGINQDETFIPASLFKVPIMITYLKDAESDPNLLSTKIVDTLTQNENERELTKPLQSIIEGRSYTVEQLLKYMIEYSDNNATVLLFKHINQTMLKQVFSDLDIQLPSSGLNTDFISVQEYSFFFRVLYNATYLSHDMSEKGLEMLSSIDFNDGIRKNIPASIPVADKFGEYYLLDNGKASGYQLHDCGIVYHPKHPYLLCVMTKGDSFDSLKKVIQDISSSTYSAVNMLP